jgi:hypothetical protein
VITTLLVSLVLNLKCPTVRSHPYSAKRVVACEEVKRSVQCTEASIEELKEKQKLS